VQSLTRDTKDVSRGILCGRNLYIIKEMYLKDHVVCVNVNSMVETGEENL
jgi:hypothetical protein